MAADEVKSDFRVVGALSLLYIFRMLGLFMVFPVMMVFGAEYGGATPLLLGLALGCYGYSQALLQIPLGLLSDLIGRKPVILLGLLLFIAGSVVAALADTVWGLIAGRAIQGAGAIASALMALVGDITSEQNRTKAMAVIGVSIGLSFTLAISLGQEVAAWGGLNAIFWLSSALALLGIVVLYALVPSPPPNPRPKARQPVSALFKNVVRSADLLRLDLGIFVLHFILAALFVVVPLALQGQGVTVNFLYLKVLLLAFVAMLPFMYLAERKRRLKAVFIGAVALLLITQLGFAAAAQSWHWVAGLFAFFTAFNLLEATLPSLVSKQAPPGSKGAAMGVYSTCQFLGAALGGSLGGVLYGQLGAGAVFALCGVMCLLWLFVACFMRPPRLLSSLVLKQDVSLNGAEVEAEVPGVVEANWVKEQALLYLKVDDTQFRRQALNDFLHRREGRVV